MDWVGTKGGGGVREEEKLKEKYWSPSPKLPFWFVSSSIFSEITPLCFGLLLPRMPIPSLTSVLPFHPLFFSPL